MSTENYRNTRLQKLSNSDFEIADGESDIRGWDVKDASGKQLGEVEELIFDYESRKVRYLVVDLEDNEFDLEDKEVLVPIGIAELHEDDDDVILNGVTAEQISALPEYDEDRFDTDHENNVRNVFGGLGSGDRNESDTENKDFYDHEQFNDQNLYRKRRGNTDVANTEQTIPVVREDLQVGKKEVETGGMRLRSRVVEKDVEEDVTLRQEKVVVDRVSTDRPATEGDFHDEDIELRERNEVADVSKNARVVEEISLDKDVTERQETISDTARKTEVDVDGDEDRLRNQRNQNDLS